jgi:hypothetical protein
MNIPLNPHHEKSCVKQRREGQLHPRQQECIQSFMEDSKTKCNAIRIKNA